MVGKGRLTRLGVGADVRREMNGVCVDTAGTPVGHIQWEIAGRAVKVTIMVDVIGREKVSV